MREIVPHIWLGTPYDVQTANKKKMHDIQAGYHPSLDDAREMLWWAWGHNEDVLVYDETGKMAEEAIVYFLRTDSAREFIEFKKKE